MAPEDAAKKPKARELPREVANAIIEGYYSRGVAAADRARDRADKGYTIASALAAALVAAGVFAHLDEKPEVVQITGLVALGCWLLAALLFIYAVSLPVRDDEDDAEGWDSELAFANGVATQVSDEVSALRRRLLLAVGATIAATAVTVSALALATTLPAPSKAERERVALTPRGDRYANKLCSRPVGDVWAWLDPSKLTDAIVSLVLPAGECNAGKTTLRMQKADIAATEKVPFFPKFRS